MIRNKQAVNIGVAVLRTAVRCSRGRLGSACHSAGITVQYISIDGSCIGKRYPAECRIRQAVAFHSRKICFGEVEIIGAAGDKRKLLCDVPPRTKSHGIFCFVRAKVPFRICSVIVIIPSGKGIAFLGWHRAWFGKHFPTYLPCNFLFESFFPIVRIKSDYELTAYGCETAADNTAVVVLHRALIVAAANGSGTLVDHLAIYRLTPCARCSVYRSVIDNAVPIVLFAVSISNRTPVQRAD